MLTLLDKDGPYLLPTGWHEVTTQQFCDTDGMKTMEARASHFAGRPIQVNGLVSDALAFMLGKPSAFGGLPYPKDLGQETYLQVETLRALLGAQPLHACYCEVYGLIQGRWHNGARDFRQGWASRVAEYCADYPVTDTWPAVHHCLNELDRLSTKYAYLAEPDHTEAARKAREAGADKLDMFGHLNVARHYAREFGKTIDEVYQMPFETIMLFLMQDKVQAEVNDTLTQNSKTHE